MYLYTLYRHAYLETKNVVGEPANGSKGIYTILGFCRHFFVVAT